MSRPGTRPTTAPVGLTPTETEQTKIRLAQKLESISYYFSAHKAVHEMTVKQNEAMRQAMYSNAKRIPRIVVGSGREREVVVSSIRGKATVGPGLMRRMKRIDRFVEKLDATAKDYKKDDESKYVDPGMRESARLEVPSYHKLMEGGDLDGDATHEKADFAISCVSLMVPYHNPEQLKPKRAQTARLPPSDPFEQRRKAQSARGNFSGSGMETRPKSAGGAKLAKEIQGEPSPVTIREDDDDVDMPEE